MTEHSPSTDDEDMEDALFDDEGFRTGMMVGNSDSSENEEKLGRQEEAANTAEEQKLVYKFIISCQRELQPAGQVVRSLISGR